MCEAEGRDPEAFLADAAADFLDWMTDEGGFPREEWNRRFTGYLRRRFKLYPKLFRIEPAEPLQEEEATGPEFEEAAAPEAGPVEPIEAPQAPEIQPEPEPAPAPPASEPAPVPEPIETDEERKTRKAAFADKMKADWRQTAPPLDPMPSLNPEPTPKRELPPEPTHPRALGVEVLGHGVRIALDHMDQPDDLICEEFSGVTLEDCWEARRLLKVWNEAMAAHRVECARLREEWRRKYGP